MACPENSFEQILEELWSKQVLKSSSKFGLRNVNLEIRRGLTDSGVRVAKLSTIHLTGAMDMPRKPFEANTNTRRVMVKTSFEIVEQIWSARNLPICAKSNRRIQFRPSMTHRCGSSGVRVSTNLGSHGHAQKTHSKIHLTVANVCAVCPENRLRQTHAAVILCELSSYGHENKF